ncbi:MAG: hypothetical protein KTR27_15400 [Leptolyngbyaceae cyanobacterium MAG.088]|nr:hypothetical protein [Leptolyngbyaceae cyanobacterium MAG.088]
MQAVKKIFVGLLLLIGLPIVILAAVDLADPEETRESKQGALAAMVFFGLPPVAVSTGLMFNLRQSHQHQSQQMSLLQEQSFLQLLQQQQGKISAANFALAAKIPLEEAKEYLDQKAQQLDADFEVSDNREIIYKFPS